ncbi:MAG: SH3 domain-containing protein [Candidatus Desantisbacteria bacterium]
MKKLLFCMVIGILLLGCVNAIYAEDIKGQSAIIAEADSVKSKKIIAKPQVSSIEGNSSVKGATTVSIPQTRDDSWKKGKSAFDNYDYEQAISCFIESPSPLAKYYLAKIYFGDVPINTVEGVSLPEINRQKSIEVLDTVINYKESQELKNKYAALMNSPEDLSKFYYEQGNYGEAEKAIELVQGKETEEVQQKNQSYSQSFENSTLATSTHSEEVVFSEQSVQPESKLPPEVAVVSVQPELKLPPKATVSQNTVESQSETTFVEEKGRGHDSFSEAACFVDGRQQQIGDENDEMITVDSQPSHTYAKEHCPEPMSEETPIKGNTLVSIKPAIVWDWPALPGYDYKPVARIEENKKMVLIDDVGNKWYYKVELSDGKIGYICSYLVEVVDRKAKESVQKTRIIEEVSEYVNYLVDRHEEKKEAAKPVKKKKKQVTKKKQPVKSIKAQAVKPPEQQGVVFVDEVPVQRQSATATEHKPPAISEHKPASVEGHH